MKTIKNPHTSKCSKAHKLKFILYNHNPTNQSIERYRDGGCVLRTYGFRFKSQLTDLGELLSFPDRFPVKSKWDNIYGHLAQLKHSGRQKTAPLIIIKQL